jgi:hypothetical protein
MSWAVENSASLRGCAMESGFLEAFRCECFASKNQSFLKALLEPNCSRPTLFNSVISRGFFLSCKKNWEHGKEHLYVRGDSERREGDLGKTNTGSVACSVGNPRQSGSWLAC